MCKWFPLCSEPGRGPVVWYMYVCVVPGCFYPSSCLVAYVTPGALWVRSLQFSLNAITGTFPSMFIGLGALTQLDVGQNMLSGPLPPSFTGTPSLAYVRSKLVLNLSVLLGHCAQLPACPYRASCPHSISRYSAKATRGSCFAVPTGHCSAPLSWARCDQACRSRSPAAVT